MLAGGRLPDEPTADAHELTALLAEAKAGDYIALMGYLAPSIEVDERRRRAARDADAGDEARRHLRLRPALPALDWTAAQGRSAAWALPLADRRPPLRGAGRERRRDPGDRVSASARSRPRRRSATCRRCESTACRPSSSATTAILPRLCESSTNRSGGSSDADRLRRARQDGRQHGHAHPARLRPRGRRVRLQRQAVKAAEARARAARTRSRAREAARRAAAGLDHGPGRRTRPSPTVDALAKLLEPGDMIIDGGNSHWTDDKARADALAPAGIHYVDVGTSGGVWGLEVGYCMMVGGPRSGRTARADPRCAGAPTAANGRGDRPARLVPLRRGGAGPLREDGPQRDRVRADAGLRRGLRALPCAEYELDNAKIAHLWNQASSSAHGCASSPRAPSRRTATTSTTLEGWVEDSGEGRWTLLDAIDHGVPTPALWPRCSAASTRASTATTRARARRPAQPVRWARRQARAVKRAARPADHGAEPARRGLERLPVRRPAS